MNQTNEEYARSLAMCHAVDIVYGKTRWQLSPGWGDCAKAERDARDAIETCIAKIHAKHPSWGYAEIAERLFQRVGGRMRSVEYHRYATGRPSDIDAVDWEGGPSGS